MHESILGMSSQMRDNYTTQYISYRIEGNTFASLSPRRYSFDIWFYRDEAWTQNKIEKENVSFIPDILEKVKASFISRGGIVEEALK